jgi:DNA replication and repair protein RecF
MIVRYLKIDNFRNHISTSAEFGRGVNFIYGLNGAGKTSILEAIHLASLSKSFLPVHDHALIRSGEESFTINLESITELNTPYKVGIVYQHKRKKINSSLGDNLLPKDLVGELPIVLLSPDDKNITFGTPADRRGFADKLLSQCRRLYLDDLILSKKAIKQRNSVLATYQSSHYLDEELFSSWTEYFIKASARIVQSRIRFAMEFSGYFMRYYSEISMDKESVGFEYQPYGFADGIINNEIGLADIESELKAIADRMKVIELRRGISCFGPQKDDFIIKINHGTSKDVASQGQHKTLLISIKFAELQYLNDIKKESPVLLLDDVFSELDSERSGMVLKLLSESEYQTFITSTMKLDLRSQLPVGISVRNFYVSDGTVKDMGGG